MAKGPSKGRGRPRKDKASDAAPEAGAPAAEAAAGHNKPELTDEEKRALLFQHMKHFKGTLEGLKQARTAHQNVCKRAKAECGADAVTDIKDAIAFEAPNGQQLFAAEVERKQRVARWMGLPVGAQVAFNFTDRTPVDDRAHDQGKQAGMEGLNCAPPASCHAPEKWTAGWHEGQAVLMSAFGKVKKAGGAEDAAGLAEAEAEGGEAGPSLEGAEAAGSYEMTH